jgi:hypothetical protein
METLFGLAKAIPPDAWLVMSVFLSAVVIGVHAIIAHFVGRDAIRDDTDTGTPLESDRELLSS